MCDLSFTFTGTAAELLDKITVELEANGGTINTTDGTFSVGSGLTRIDGSFTINGQQLNVHIAHKPFILSCSTIENKINEFLQ